MKFKMTNQVFAGLQQNKPNIRMFKNFSKENSLKHDSMNWESVKIEVTLKKDISNLAKFYLLIPGTRKKAVSDKSLLTLVCEKFNCMYCMW